PLTPCPTRGPSLPTWGSPPPTPVPSVSSRAPPAGGRAPATVRAWGRNKRARRPLLSRGLGRLEGNRPTAPPLQGFFAQRYAGRLRAVFAPSAFCGASPRRLRDALQRTDWSMSDVAEPLFSGALSMYCVMRARDTPSRPVLKGRDHGPAL